MERMWSVKNWILIAIGLVGFGVGTLPGWAGSISPFESLTQGAFRYADRNCAHCEETDRFILPQQVVERDLFLRMMRLADAEAERPASRSFLSRAPDENFEIADLPHEQVAHRYYREEDTYFGFGLPYYDEQRGFIEHPDAPWHLADQSHCYGFIQHRQNMSYCPTLLSLATTSFRPFR